VAALEKLCEDDALTTATGAPLKYKIYCLWQLLRIDFSRFYKVHTLDTIPGTRVLGYLVLVPYWYCGTGPQY
jgi:hypothetical protein